MATPIGASDRHIYRGVARFFFSAGIADIEAVTATELAAATDLSAEVREVIGWEIVSDLISTPIWGIIFQSQRPGGTQVGKAQLLMYADRAGADIRTLLTRGVAGWVLILPSGEVAGHPMNVYPVTVAAVPQPITIDGAAMLLVTFAVTAEPAPDVPVPAP